MHKFMYLFLIFFSYSVLGWTMEVICTGIKNRKLINRGFLIGPYCPIYGVAALVVVLLLGKYEKDYIVVFATSALISAFLEYITSYVLEKMFKARWWDYSNKPFNLNGRVCLRNFIFFGILGVVVISFIHPLVKEFILDIPTYPFYPLSIFFLCVFAVDCFISFNTLKNLKLTLQTIKKDSTEEISKKVRQTLAESSKLFSRVLNAFPNVKPLGIKKRIKLLKK